MNEAVKVRLTHALLSMLLAAGILLPLLGIMDPSFLSPAVLLWCAGIILLFELASVKQIVSIAMIIESIDSDMNVSNRMNW